MDEAALSRGNIGADEANSDTQMPNTRLPKALCVVVGEMLQGRGSHDSLNALFVSAGVPGDPPNLAHTSKWKEWLFRAGQDPNVDSLSVLGTILEEFMDVGPKPGSEGFSKWEEDKARVVQIMEEFGLRYFRGGVVLPTDAQYQVPTSALNNPGSDRTSKPTRIAEHLNVILKGLPRAMRPLTHRRKGAQPLYFNNEYDVQDLLHSHLRPWITDIRPEEFTPSYAGSSTRMDFLLPTYKLVIELKIVRDISHAKRIGDELTIDIAHYRRHPDCQELWCVIYDPNHLISNPAGLKNDLGGLSTTKDGSVHVEVVVISS